MKKFDMDDFLDDIDDIIGCTLTDMSEGDIDVGLGISSENYAGVCHRATTKIYKYLIEGILKDDEVRDNDLHNSGYEGD